MTASEKGAAPPTPGTCPARELAAWSTTPPSGALKPMDHISPRQWQRAFETNLRGSLWCAQRARPLMPSGGAIVNLSLGSSLVTPYYTALGTTKAALESLTRYLAVEFAPDGIRVNAAAGGLLSAGATNNPAVAPLVETVAHSTPLGKRPGHPDELAALAHFLASPAASWITGQTVIADGGYSLQVPALAQ